MEEIQIGDKYKGLINNVIIEVISIDEKHNELKYKCNNKIDHYNLEAFKHLLIKKV